VYLGLGLRLGSGTFKGYDSDAATYFNTAGVTDATAKQQINAFVVGVKALGLYNNMVCWPLRSAQNKGSGTTAYSLGGLGTYNGTLTNGPTWGASGITFDGVDDYLPTGYTSGLSQFSAFSIATPNSTAGVQEEFSKDDQGSNRDWVILGALSGYNQAFIWDASQTLRQNTGPLAGLVSRLLCLRASSTVYKFRRNNESDTPGTLGTINQSSANITIGARAGGGGLYFSGIVSAGILFNTVLSDSDTSSIYTLYKTTLGTGLGLP
jgi:hypothetical protein